MLTVYFHICIVSRNMLLSQFIERLFSIKWKFDEKKENRDTKKLDDDRNFIILSAMMIVTFTYDDRNSCANEAWIEK